MWLRTVGKAQAWVCTAAPSRKGRAGLAACSAGPGPAHQLVGGGGGGLEGDVGATSAEGPCRGLTSLAEGLQAHELVGCGAVHHSLQNALNQGWLVAWENPQVLSRLVAEAWAALAGEFHQERGAAGNGNGKEKPLVTHQDFLQSSRRVGRFPLDTGPPFIFLPESTSKGHQHPLRRGTQGALRLSRLAASLWGEGGLHPSLCSPPKPTRA